MSPTRRTLSLLFFSCFLLLSGTSKAQFVDEFEGNRIDGWTHATGDGQATMDFVQKDKFAQIRVDATDDTHNIWWAIIKRNVAPALDLSRLEAPNHELRVEARVRVSHAPRRLNFMVNTQRTTNFHKQLMEYDIPDTTGWHTISMTTDDLDAVPGDSLYVQLGVTDWGRGTYQVDLDSYRAEIIDTRRAGPDKGTLVPYHPPIPDPDTFSNHLDATHDAVVNTDYPEVNFHDWHAQEEGREVPVLTVSANQWAVLRWDFGPHAEVDAKGAGLLELTTQSVAKGGDYVAAYGEALGGEFGKVRVIEILGGDGQWTQDSVTYERLLQGQSYADVFNGQMVYDKDVSRTPGEANYVTISEPVLQRLLNGTTKGLLIRPLGAIDASFYDSETENGDWRPTLHFTVEE